MKYLLRNIACAILLLSLFNCSTEPVEDTQDILNVTQSEDFNLATTNDDDDCEGQSPKARLINNGTIDFNLEIYNENGTLVCHEYGIEPGETSTWKIFASGETTFMVSNANSDKVIVLEMNSCMAYEMEIGANNQLTSDQPFHL